MAILLVLVACEDKFEVTYRYSRPYNVPILLDASEILVDIQVKPSINPDAAFKIASNDQYFFVGEKMKGVHVYEKTDEFHASPLCFIECQQIKAFDVENNILYCNNFTDLLVLDIENPLQAKILHREKDYFNKYSNSTFNLPIFYNVAINANVYEIGYQLTVLTNVEIDANPNIIVKQIPNNIQINKPFAGIINVESNIFTLGNNNIMQCSYTPDGFEISQSAINFPNYPSVMPTDNLQYKNGVIFLIGGGIIGINGGFIYWDYQNMSEQIHGYRPWWPVRDVVSLKEQANNHAAIWQGGDQNDIYFDLVRITEDGVYNGGFDARFFGVPSIINVNDTILTLGNQLTLHRSYINQYNAYSFERVKLYTNISGSAMLRDGDRLIVANKQGLFIYNISDLQNIKLIP